MEIYKGVIKQEELYSLSLIDLSIQKLFFNDFFFGASINDYGGPHEGNSCC